MLGRYQKTVTALVAGVIGWGAVVVASPTNAITSSEWLGLAVVVATALGVYAVPNDPPKPVVPPAQLTTSQPMAGKLPS